MTSYMRRRIIVESDSDFDNNSVAKYESALFDGDGSDDDVVVPKKEDKVIVMFEDKHNLLKKRATKKATYDDGSLSDSSSSLGDYIAALSIEDKEKHEPSPPEESQSDESQEKRVRSPSNGGSEVMECDSESAWTYDADREEYFLDQSKSVVRHIRWPKFRIPASLYEKLYDFQLVGVQWIASLHENGIGGILGDDMGMGKTYTTLSFLGGMMRTGSIKNALVIAPLSLLRNWKKEAQRILLQCVPRLDVRIVSSEMSAKERKRFLREAAMQRRQNRCHIVITTYGLARNAQNDFVFFEDDPEGRKWDYVVLDEAHNIKNPATGANQSCHAICHNPDTHRLLLSGTPILNNLTELWSLFDFATSGGILGELKVFKQLFANPIEAARDSKASDATIQHGERKNAELQEIVKPYFLQRLKKDYLKDKLPKKTELVVWTHISERQREMYEDFLSKDDNVYSILRGEKISPLTALTTLKRLCCHPYLLEKEEEQRFTHQEAVFYSEKLGVLVALIDRLKDHGHRTLVFSQSTQMLDIIQHVLKKRDVRLTRIDGNTKEHDRQRFVDDFNSSKSKTQVMLLSTKAAGVGLTLTGADSVIVHDPSWTPAEDSQAVDRAYRLGQAKPVTVYRLITAGTVEEKMYERQVHKDGIQRTVFGAEGESVERYFAHNELRELFKLAPAGECKVMEKVHEAMSGQKLDWAGHEFVFDLPGVVGMSRHDGFYSLCEKQRAEAEPSKKVFEGSLKDTARKVLGKSQRVLQRTEPKPNIPETVSNPRPPLRERNSTAENACHDPSQLKGKRGAGLVQTMCAAETAGQPRKALSLGLDILEKQSADLTPQDRIAVLHIVANTGYLLGLLPDA